MLIYPFRSPIILTRNLFVEYGGQAGTFSDAPLTQSFLMAEILLTSYIGTPLLPVNMTGTYNFSLSDPHIVTDYGYVQSINAVNFLSKDGCTTCGLTSNDGCAYISNDTFGYVDAKRVSGICGCGWYTNYPIMLGVLPYQIQISYTAGLPTGTANLPGIVQALTILAQIDLNEKFPGAVGMNEGVGDVGIQKYSSMDDYHEERTHSAIIRTNLGSSAKAMYAKRIVDATVKKARRVLLA